LREFLIQQAEEKALGYEKAAVLATGRQKDKETRTVKRPQEMPLLRPVRHGNARLPQRRRTRLQPGFTFSARLHTRPRQRASLKWQVASRPRTSPGRTWLALAYTGCSKYRKKELQLLRGEWTDYLIRHELIPSGDAEYTRIHVK